MWGAYWVWDARLTSELILLFLYLGYMALHGAIDDRRRGDRAGAILLLVGVVNIPIIYFSVKWWNTLHQGATISKMDKPSMSGDMLWPLLINLAGFAFLFGALTLMRLRNELVQVERQRPWVRELVEG